MKNNQISLFLIFLCCFEFSFSQQKKNLINQYDSIFITKYNNFDSSFNGEKCINSKLCISNADYLFKLYGKKKIDAYLAFDGVIGEQVRILYLRTANKKQVLKVIHMPGSKLDQFYVVEYYTDRLKGAKFLTFPYSNLVTDDKIYLGMNEYAFFLKKGNGYCEKIENKGITRYVFKWIFDKAMSENDHYICYYDFKNNKLIKYGFGISSRIWE